MAVFSVTNISVALISLYLARRAYWELTIGSKRRSIAKQKGTLPSPSVKGPAPWFLPTFGLDISISFLKSWNNCRILSHWEDELRSKDAHAVSITVLGAPVWLTDDPENVKAMLATHFDEWSLGRDRIEQMSSYLGHGVFTNEGKAWKSSREMLRPCFEKSAVADISLFEKHINHLFHILPQDGTTVDLQPLFHELTLDIATEFLFGRSTASLERKEGSEEVREFIRAFEYCANPFYSANYKKYGLVGLLMPDWERKRSAKTVKAFAEKIIDEEVSQKQNTPASKSTRYIFLDELLAATQDRTTIRSELLNILLAGRDTTAALLSNVIWDLSRHPEILQRLRAEIDEFVGPDPASLPTYETLKNMKYLRAIINESQRLYPIVPANSREALVDTTLPRGGGPDGQSPILVPKGCYVAYVTWAMHRRQDIYGSNADQFRPERWLDPGSRPGWAYIPFSGGPRVCIGQNFALTEAMFVVVRLVQRFEIERRDWEVWREKLSTTCTGEGGCKVGLRRRGV